MKRIHRTLLAIVAVGAVGSSVRGQTPVVSAPQTAPQIPWANKFFLPDIAKNPTQPPPPVVSHDFGTVPHGTLCAHTFTITNIYDEPMQVVEVRKSCDCLDYVPLTQVLKPNDMASFTVTMNTGKFVGFNSQTFYITFGPKFVSTAVLRLQATSRADVVLNPGAVSFGAVALGNHPTQSVRLEYKGKARDWKILSILQPSPAIDVQVKETGRGRMFGGAEYQVEVSLRPGALAGAINEQVGLKTNDATNPVVYLSVTGTVQAPLEVAPAAVRFDAVPLDQMATQRVIVRAGKPFRILLVENQGDGITVELPPTNVPLPVNVLTVKFAPAQAGSINKVLLIRTDLDGRVTAPLLVEGEGAK